MSISVLQFDLRIVLRLSQFVIRLSSVLGREQRSLAHLVRDFCAILPDKSMQRSDWRQRPLTQEQLRYARLDVHYLVYIARQLCAELCAQVPGGKQKDTSSLSPQPLPQPPPPPPPPTAMLGDPSLSPPPLPPAHSHVGRHLTLPSGPHSAPHPAGRPLPVPVHGRNRGSGPTPPVGASCPEGASGQRQSVHLSYARGGGRQRCSSYAQTAPSIASGYPAEARKHWMGCLFGSTPNNVNFRDTALCAE
eukprot:gene11059-18666_t